MPGTQRLFSVLPLGANKFDSRAGNDKTNQIQAGSVRQPGNAVQAWQQQSLGSGRKRQSDR